MQLCLSKPAARAPEEDSFLWPWFGVLEHAFCEESLCYSMASGVAGIAVLTRPRLDTHCTLLCLREREMVVPQGNGAPAPKNTK